MNRKININGKTLLVALLTLGMLVGGVGSAYAVTTLDATARFTAGVAGASELLDFDSGGSQIYDDWHLHIVTDDDLFIDAPGTTTVSGAMNLAGAFLIGNGNAAGVAETITFGSTGGSSIYDDWHLHIATDDDLFLDAPGTTTISGDLVVSGGELYVTPITSSASTTEGTVYYDSDDDNLYVYANGAFVDLTAGATGAITLDTAYNTDGGTATIAVDAGDLSWDMSGNYDFVMDIQGLSSIVRIEGSSSALYAWNRDGALDITPGSSIGEDVIDITTAMANAHEVIDIDMTGVHTGDVIDIAYTGVATGNAVYLDMGTNVAGDAVNVNTAATTGSALDVTATGVFTDALLNVATTAAWTGNLMDVDVASTPSGNVLDVTYSGVATGNAIDLNMATNVGGTAIDVSSAATTGSGLVMAFTALTTGDMVNLQSPASRTSGSVIEITEAGATGVASVPTIDINVTSTLTQNVLDITHSGVSTGNSIDLNQATNVAGDAVNINTAATTGNALDVTASGVFTNELIDVNTSAAWTGNLMDVDVASTPSGNVFDVTYSGVATGNAIDLNMATNVAGNALDIASSQTTGNAIDVTSDAVFTNQLIDINTSGVWTGNLLDITSGAQAVTGNYIDINPGDAAQTGDVYNLAIPASALTLQNFVVTNAAISTAATNTGWLLDVNSTAAQAANWVDFDSTAAWTGNMFNVDNSNNAIWTGNVFDLNSGTGVATGDFMNLNIEAGSTAMQAIVVDNDAITATAGWGLYLDTALAWTNDAILFDSADAAWTGDWFQMNGGAGAWTGDFFSIDGEGAIATGNIFDIETGAGANTGNVMDIAQEDVLVQDFVVNNTVASTVAGWLFDVNTTAAWTGIAMDFEIGTAISTGALLDVTYADVAHTGATFDINMGTNLAGNALDIQAEGVRSAPLIFINGDNTDGGTDDHVIDIDQDGKLDSNVLDITFGTAASVGNAIDLNMGTNIAGDGINIATLAGRTGGSAIQIDDAGLNGSVTAALIDVNLTGTTDLPALDITFSGVAIAGGNAIDLNMATAVVNDAINIDTEATDGHAILIDSGGAISDSLIDVDMSAGDWQGNIFEVTTGAQASDGNVFDVTLEALDVAVQNMVVTGAAASSTAGWLLEANVTGVTTADAIDIDDNATTAAGAINIDYAALVDGDIVTLADSGADRTTGHILAINDAGDASLGTGSAVHITQSTVADYAAVEIDTAGVGASDVGAGLDVGGTGAVVSGGSLVYIHNTAASGGATAYALHIEAGGANFEALHVDAGEALFDEQVTITAGGLTVTAGGITVTAGDVTLVDGAMAAANEAVASATNMAIDSNVVTVSGSTTIDTITGGVDGQLLVLIFGASVTVSDDDAATAGDAMNLAGTTTDFSATVTDTLTLVYDGTSWYEVSHSVND